MGHGTPSDTPNKSARNPLLPYQRIETFYSGEYRAARVPQVGAVSYTRAAAHELVALSPEQALPVAVVWLKR